MARKKFIERIKTENYALDFYVDSDPRLMIILFTDRKKRVTSNYNFSTSSTSDWVSAIKLVNVMRKYIKEQEELEA